jgi:dethiobiotin synthetase
MTATPGIFVTGTDTEVGKTLISTALMRAFKKQGLRVAGMKPVASGSRPTPQGLRNADAEALMREQSVPLPYEWVNPYAFVPATSPHIAAAAVGVTIAAQPLLSAFAEIRRRVDRVVVEGAGGWYAPLSEDLCIEDLALAFGLPVVLVVAVRLGCINHARLTAEAIERSSLPLCGWVANQIDAQFQDWQENIAALTRRLNAPLIGIVQHQSCIDPERAALSLELAKMTGRDRT